MTSTSKKGAVAGEGPVPTRPPPVSGWISPTFWISPSLRRDYDTGTVTITDPPSLKGRQVVGVEGFPCAEPTPSGMCGLIKGHAGTHWNCSPELVERDGPWAVVRDPR